MDWESLYELRMKFAGNPQAQELIAPYEHRAYAREEAASNPVSALGYATLLVPGYQLAKMAHLTPVDDMSTGPSMKQLMSGIQGAGEGFGQFMRTTTADQ